MFDLNAASEKTTSKFQGVGIFDGVKISNIIKGESSQKKTPYIRLETKGENGEVGFSTDMYLSTEIGEGKKTSAWSITARNLVDIIISVTGKTELEAKASINVASVDELVSKLSSLLIGKPFRASFFGKEIQGKDGKDNWVKAHLGYTESMKVDKLASKLKFDPNNVKHLEKLPVLNTDNSVNADW